VQDYYTVPPNNTAQMIQYVMKQPITVYIDANQTWFHSYSGGIITNTTTCTTETDHAVTVVGFGVSPDGVQYWIVKNSWGTSWGENGYFRMATMNSEDGGICGIATSPYTGRVALT